MDISFIPTHHELIIIERALIDVQEHYDRRYKEQCDFIDTLEDEQQIVDAMRALCWIHDFRLEIKSLLQRFKDYRIRDYKNKTYL